MDINDIDKTIFISSIYSAVCKKTQKTLLMFDAFCEDDVALHIFMSDFDKGREYFRYDSFFPHYVVPARKREMLIEAGAVVINREGEKACIHNWHNKAVENRFFS